VSAGYLSEMSKSGSLPAEAQAVPIKMLFELTIPFPFRRTYNDLNIVSI
jgi:hypothetical protein